MSSLKTNYDPLLNGRHMVAEIIRTDIGLLGQQNIKTCGPKVLKRAPGQQANVNVKACKVPQGS